MRRRDLNGSRLDLGNRHSAGAIARVTVALQELRESPRSILLRLIKPTWDLKSNPWRPENSTFLSSGSGIPVAFWKNSFGEFKVCPSLEVETSS